MENKQIKVICPAKINLDLRVFKKDPKTGFHNIKSIMQAISLFDTLKISLNSSNKITLKGDSKEIPYDETNLCYKAAKLFLDEIKVETGVDIIIEKKIPVAAGLAGGSTDASGVLIGLNSLFNNKLDDITIEKLANSLGSDLNFCLKGGTALCTGRGEIITPMPFYKFNLALIKPKDLKISAKTAYSLFDELEIESDMRNDLEFALLKKGNYPQIHYLRSFNFQMSGSGPTFFQRDKNIDEKKFDKNSYLIINNLYSIDHGVKLISWLISRFAVQLCSGVFF